QIILEEMGIEGQARLLHSKVLIVGAGGLGSPTALYLAAAGVGTIGIVDGDQVDVTNLHRQILHGTPDLGRPKTESAQRTLGGLNPDVTVVPHQTVRTSANALDILGALCGYMGSRQALEAMKLLLGVGETLANRLLIYDALEGETRVVRWNRNPECPVCGDRPTIRALIDYEQFCGMPAHDRAAAPAKAPVPQVTPEEAKALLARGGVQLVDVREPWEYEEAHIPGGRLIPVGEVRSRLQE